MTKTTQHTIADKVYILPPSCLQTFDYNRACNKVVTQGRLITQTFLPQASSILILIMATNNMFRAQKTFTDATAVKDSCNSTRGSPQISETLPLCNLVCPHTDKNSCPRSQRLSTENVRGASKPSRASTDTLLSSGPDVEETFQDMSEEMEEWFKLLARQHQQAKERDRHWLVRLLTCGCLIC
jgi:hypothetical protein